jgi:TM2 domain-containing membrane protein YozV
LAATFAVGTSAVGDWFYIGHYGQLGPLTREQFDELIQGGVIGRETFVWRSGMTTWVRADSVPELAGSFASVFASTPPPPPEMLASAGSTSTFMPSDPLLSPHYATHPTFTTVKSDRSRLAAGIIQLLLPGVGRMYMGYGAIGVLQLVLAFCGGVGYIWSVIDGIVILSGGVKMDGYGRQMKE